MQAKQLFLALVVVAVAAEARAQGTGLVTSDGLNQVLLVETTYTGFCPGQELSRAEARFVSATTATGPGLRVRVTNLGPGVETDPHPYTDREYDEGGRSERTILDLDDEHHTRTLSVREGVNHFEYRIYRESDERSVERGQFELVVRVLREGPVDRPPYCEWRSRCDGPGPCTWRYECWCR